MRALRAAGWEVVGVARREDRLRALAEETGASVFVADLTDQRDVDALRDHLAATGPLHALVNNAGGAKGLDSVEDSSVDDWAWMFEVNVLALKRVTSALLPLLRRGAVERGVADIVNVTSIAGHTAYAGGGGYNAAKFAAHALTEVLRLELNGEPLRVVEVAPGMVRTDEFALVRFGGDRARADAVYDDVPEPLVAEDIAGVIVDAVQKPRHVDLDLIVVKPVAQAAPYRLAKGDLVVRPEAARMSLRGVPEGDPATHRRKRYVDATGRALALLGVAFVMAYTVYVLWPDRPQWVTTVDARRPPPDLGDLRRRRHHPHRAHAARSTLALRLASSLRGALRPPAGVPRAPRRRTPAGPPGAEAAHVDRRQGAVHHPGARLRVRVGVLPRPRHPAGRARRARREHRDVRRCHLVGDRHDRDRGLRRRVPGDRPRPVLRGAAHGRRHRDRRHRVGDDHLLPQRAGRRHAAPAATRSRRPRSRPARSRIRRPRPPCRPPKRRPRFPTPSRSVPQGPPGSLSG